MTLIVQKNATSVGIFFSFLTKCLICFGMINASNMAMAGKNITHVGHTPNGSVLMMNQLDSGHRLSIRFSNGSSFMEISSDHQLELADFDLNEQGTFALLVQFNGTLEIGNEISVETQCLKTFLGVFDLDGRLKWWELLPNEVATAKVRSLAEVISVEGTMVDSIAKETSYFRILWNASGIPILEHHAPIQGIIETGDAPDDPDGSGNE